MLAGVLSFLLLLFTVLLVNRHSFQLQILINNLHLSFLQLQEPASTIYCKASHIMMFPPANFTFGIGCLGCYVLFQTWCGQLHFKELGEKRVTGFIIPSLKQWSLAETLCLVVILVVFVFCFFLSVGLKMHMQNKCRCWNMSF